MRMASLVAALSFVMLGTYMSVPANAQSVHIGPRGVTVSPPGQEPEQREYAPPPRRGEGDARDELRERMFRLRSACENDDRRACVRLGIIIGEHKERREAWRREHPDLFFWER